MREVCNGTPSRGVGAKVKRILVGEAGGACTIWRIQPLYRST